MEINLQLIHPFKIYNRIILGKQGNVSDDSSCTAQTFFFSQMLSRMRMSYTQYYLPMTSDEGHRCDATKAYGLYKNRKCDVPNKLPV